MKLLAFCEAAADFRLLSALIDRVLCVHGPAWITDVLEGSPAAIRTWIADPDGNPFWDTHRVYAYAARFCVRLPHGHFGGEPGAFAAVAARTTFVVARHVSRSEDLEGVVLVCDMDNQPVERRKGLEQARREAEVWASFAIVIGCADAERETWVLAGFDPLDDDERARLDDVTREIGFSPVLAAHRLDAIHDTDKKSPKRVLAILVAGDPDREVRCWLDTPLDRLRERGTESGLADFLSEIETRLIPRVLRGAGGRDS